MTKKIKSIQSQCLIMCTVMARKMTEIFQWPKCPNKKTSAVGQEYTYTSCNCIRHEKTKGKHLLLKPKFWKHIWIMLNNYITWVSEEFFPGGGATTGFFRTFSRVVKFVFSYSKLRKQPFLLQISKSRGKALPSWRPCYPASYHEKLEGKLP